MDFLCDEALHCTIKNQNIHLLSFDAIQYDLSLFLFKFIKFLEKILIKNPIGVTNEKI